MNSKFILINEYVTTEYDEWSWFYEIQGTKSNGYATNQLMRQTYKLDMFTLNVVHKIEGGARSNICP